MQILLNARVYCVMENRHIFLTTRGKFSVVQIWEIPCRRIGINIFVKVYPKINCKKPEDDIYTGEKFAFENNMNKALFYVGNEH